MESKSRLPGGEMANRPLHFFWICDCSGSMSVNGKIQSLNDAIRQAMPLMKQEADDNPNAQVWVHTLRFSTGASWHIPESKVEEFKWEDLTADGITDMGKALSMVAEQLKMPPMEQRALPPVLVLISDGQPSDDYRSGLDKLMEQPWGKKAVRIAISVGQDADHDVLQRFIGNPELKPLQANNPDALVKLIKWASTSIKAVSVPHSRKTNNNPDIPAPPPLPDPPPVPDLSGSGDGDDSWVF